MKLLMLVMGFNLLALSSCATTKDSAALNSNVSSHNLSNSKQIISSGDITVEYLKKHHPDFFHDWLTQFDPLDVKILANIDEPITIVTYFAVWCHDSQREIPKLLTLLEKIDNKNISHILIALDRNKQEGLNRQQDDQIDFTPTIVVKKSQLELGRITEKPKKGLAKDLIAIIKSKSPPTLL